MVAEIASGANVIALFGSRPVAPAERADARAEFRAESSDGARPDSGRREGGRAVAGGLPRSLLSFDGAASLQEGTQLNDQEQAEVRELKARDTEVRQHERAHAAAGGQYAGAPAYEFQRGPDGRDYAVSGEVPIDVSPVAGDPAKTVDKMEQVKAAALAPAEPSAQDRKVAAQAEAERQKAVRELNEQKAEGGDGFQAFTAGDFRRVGPAPAANVPAAPTRPGRPSVLDIVV